MPKFAKPHSVKIPKVQKVTKGEEMPDPIDKRYKAKRPRVKRKSSKA